MQRATTKLKIEDYEFEVKTYATAAEANTIRQAYFIGTKVEVIGEQPKISEFNPGVQFEVQKEMIRQMVVSVDGGVTEGIVEYCLELPSDVFDDLASQLDDLVAKKRSRAGHRSVQHGSRRPADADGSYMPRVRLDV